MNLEMTLSFVRAEVQRAEHHGNTSVELNLKDMLELLPLIESGMHKNRAERPMKRAGWTTPAGMRAMMSGGKSKRAIRMFRFKTPEHNLELFFCDNVAEKIAESEALVAARAAKEGER
ncbi:hypothetical protein N5D52_19245 [Pseudomonas sp. GD03860]|uniref:hypothetical protein n=1 Tax=Pseudomonas sp. GD03860 TaxID=2975389 RepID=UPI0024497349|nr:hypothetical protein [Pseudomonas sp. GD03860]MDH0639075.1 hypothetical protein [Pseudomonas sp. GD03860]